MGGVTVPYTVGQKTAPSITLSFTFYFDSVWLTDTLMNFQLVAKLSTSHNECHYTTLCKTTCVSLFIITVIQSLNVMTKLQLRGQTYHIKYSKCLPLALTQALR